MGGVETEDTLKMLGNRLDEDDHEFDFRDEVEAMWWLALYYKIIKNMILHLQTFLKIKAMMQKQPWRKSAKRDCPQTTNYLKDIPLFISILMIEFLSRQMPIIRKYQKS